mgnify:CR=1 FL=1
MSVDKNHVLLFAPLQGKTAKENLATHFSKNLSTIVYKEGDIIYTQSEAVIYAIAAIGGIFKLVLIFK